MNVADEAIIGEVPNVQQPLTLRGPTAGAVRSSWQTPASPTLSSEHIAILTARAIDMQVAWLVGLATVDAGQGAQLLGRTDVLASAGIAIPYPASNPPYVRVRMDAGDARYLAPASVEVPVYVPGVIDAAGSGQLFVVEAPLKALSLVSAGWDAVGLGGVSTTLEKGDPPRLNASWSAVALQGRPITIVFDANRATNPEVAHAESRLAMALEAAGAKVSVAALPAAAPGRDGPDDFIAARGAQDFGLVLWAAAAADPAVRVQALEALADGKQKLVELLGDPCFLAAVLARGASVQAQIKLSPLLKGLKTDFDRALREFQARRASKRAAQEEAASSSFGSEYSVDGGRLCVCRASQHGTSLVPLCNFTARIVEEHSRTDGEQEELVFAIEGELDTGEPLPRISIGPAEFLKGTWPVERWGASARISADRDAPRHLAAAILTLSRAQKISVQVCTGWIKLGAGRWGFAHAGGLVSADAFVPVDVRLEDDLSGYRLPDEVIELDQAARAIEEFVDLVPGGSGLLLLAAVFRAPLFSARPVRGVVYLVGASGSYKTTAAMLVQSFFGAFKDPPASWFDTPAALERAAFAAKDCLVVIDDIAPKSGDSNDEVRAKASRVIRAIGNQKGRRRMHADMTAQREFPPRALVISTGEDMPHEESIIARCMVIPFVREHVRLKALTALQREAWRFPTLMRAYLAWLAPRYDAIEFELGALVDLLVPSLPSAHARTGQLVAEVLAGLELYLRFATESGLMSAENAARWRVDALAAAKSALEGQGGAQTSADPVRRYLEVVAELVHVGRLHMARGGKADTLDPRRPSVWCENKAIYLLPNEVFREAVEAMRQAGQPMALTQQELHKRLVDRGIAVPDKDRPTVKRACAGNARVLNLRREAVEHVIGAEFPGRAMSGTDGTSPLDRPISPPARWSRGGVS